MNPSITIMWSFIIYLDLDSSEKWVLTKAKMLSVSAPRVEAETSCNRSNQCSSGIVFTSEPVNRSHGGEAEVDWCLAWLRSVRFTRSLSIVLTSYKRHCCTLDCTEAPGCLYSIHWSPGGRAYHCRLPLGSTRHIRYCTTGFPWVLKILGKYYCCFCLINFWCSKVWPLAPWKRGFWTSKPTYVDFKSTFGKRRK